MTADAMLSAYPTIRHALAFVELMLEGKPDDEPESSMQLMRNANLSIEEATEMVRQCLRDEIADSNPGRYQEALDETFLPEFQTFMRAKLGMM